MRVDSARALQIVDGDQATAGDELDRLVQVMTSIVKPMGQVLPVGTEVVLHDLRKLPNSIIAIAGNVTGRQIGDAGSDHLPGQNSTTAMVLESILRGRGTGLLSYSLQLPDGKIMHCQTTVINDRDDSPLLVLCVNSLEPSPEPASPGPTGGIRIAIESTGEEVVVSYIDEFVDTLMRRAIEAEGMAVSQMKKSQKLRVVERARGAGIFRLRDSVELVASALNVSKFTIYNYLNELDSAPGPAAAR